jgi:hypothetical protein
MTTQVIAHFKLDGNLACRCSKIISNNKRWWPQHIWIIFLERATLLEILVFITVFKFWVGILIFMYFFPLLFNFGKFPNPSNFYSKVAYTFFIDISFIQSQSFMSFVAYWPWAFNIAGLKQKPAKGCLN